MKEGGEERERGGRRVSVVAVHPFYVGFDAADEVRRGRVHLLNQHLQGVLVKEGKVGRREGGREGYRGGGIVKRLYSYFIFKCKN